MSGIIAKVRTIFNEHSVIQTVKQLDTFIPPNNGWNYVMVENDLNDKSGERSFAFEDTTGKWMLFIPDADFIKVFRGVARLAANLELTNSFKASGGREKSHVFCIYCRNFKNIKFVRKIAKIIMDSGFIDNYGVKYKDGTRAIFFKPDDATRGNFYSESGNSMTLYKFTNKAELFFKEFDQDYNPHWSLVEDDNNLEVLDNYEIYFDYKYSESKGLDTYEGDKPILKLYKDRSIKT